MVQHTCKFNLIYGRNKSTNFPTPVFTELTSCSDKHGNPPKSHNKCGKCDRNFVYVPNKSTCFTAQHFTKITSPNTSLWTSPAPNCIQTERKAYNIRGQFQPLPQHSNNLSHSHNTVTHS